MKTQIKCPICGQQHDYLVKQFDPDLDAPLTEALAEEVPGWQTSQGACTRCLDQAHIEFQLKLFEGKDEPGEVNGYKILPTPLRLDAEPSYNGKGVTICFIDSGFCPHPDLVYPKNRILAHLDVPHDFAPLPLVPPPATGASYPSILDSSAWHGTMTSVVCAGNGHLSGGQYRGIACHANLVLLKVMEEGKGITSERIVAAIDWAIANRRKYRIRIINLSVTDDEEQSFRESEVDRAVERAAAKGIVVVAAAGNDPNAPLKAPANSPHALTVGGLNDRNTLNPMLNTLYHSTFGETIDRFQKPDLIAPAIWLAAPLLPGTKEQREAAALFYLAQSGDSALKAKLANRLVDTQLERSLLFENIQTVRQAIADRIDGTKFISAHYQHADGTSFAAPIVCSVIAQMLEANPLLDPGTIREILLVTCRKLSGENAARQGWGAIQPAHAVQMAAGKPLSPLPGITPVVNYGSMTVHVYLNHPTAGTVTMRGDFNGWSEEGLPLKNGETKGVWKETFPFSKRGVYRYKFLIDKETWMSDPRNPFRESDGFGDFNSKLIIG